MVVAVGHIVRRVRGAIDDLIGNVSQIDRLPAHYAHHHGLQIFAAGEDIAGIHADFLIVLRKAACLYRGIGGLQMPDDGHRR